ncbi:MAG TPA: hypothetical protein VJR70_05765, partial [Stellaceae bacterium]|nr:hypothetical protein [Stellaceae bacterium]
EIVAYALPGEVHHHIPIATTGVLAAGCALRSARTGAAAGRAMGVWAAVGLWLTPEGMPFALAAFGGLGLFWLLHPETREPGRGLRAGGTSLVLAVAAALAIDPPYAGYAAAVFDRLSIVYLVLAAIVCAIGWLLWRLDGWDLRRWLRAAIGGAAAVAGISLWLALFPSLAAGPAGLVGAADAQAFFGAIAEMQPIRSAADAISLVGGGALATLAAGGIAWRARSPLWAYAALCGGLTVLLGLLHRRFATYPEIAVLAMLPVVLQAVDRASAWRSPPIRAALRLATIALFVLAPALAGMAARRPASAAAAADAARCDPRSLEAPLRPYSGQIVIADPGDAPGLLYWTQLRTVGSLYLRDVAAYLRLRAAWRSMPSDAVPEAVRATGATLVLVCPTSRRSLLVADLPPDTLLDRLDAGNPPPWLQSLGIGAASGYRLYRIVR